MLSSMTGFGTASINTIDIHCRFDIRSINQKQLEINGNLPFFLQPFESDIRQWIAQRIRRGRLNFFLKVIHWKRTSEIYLNSERLEKILDKIKHVNQKEQINIEVDLASVLSIPEILVIDEEELAREDVIRILKPMVEEALDQLVQSRCREGEFLLAEIWQSLGKIERSVAIISRFQDESKQEIRGGFENRIQQYLEDKNLDQQRLYQELAYLLDKADIQEELVRLQSHLEQAKKLLNDEHSSGKMFLFLTQEMQREANTLGSKCHFLPIIHENLIVKEEIERIREQIQNVE